ncbi:MAG: TetR family transcriptional regulator [Nannocystaceae bacterium]
MSVKGAPEAALEPVYAAAAALVAEGRFSMTALAEALGCSRAQLYRQAGSGRALLDRLRARGVDTEVGSPAKRRILAAAEGLVARRGLVEVTIEEIAAAAEVAPVTIYRLFGDRDGLLRALIDGISPRADVDEALAGDDLEASLVAAMARMLAFIRDHRGLIASSVGGEGMAALGSLRRTNQSSRASLRRFFRRHRAALRGSPDRLVQAFMALGLGGGLMLGPEDDPRRRARALVGILLDGTRH